MREMVLEILSYMSLGIVFCSMLGIYFIFYQFFKTMFKEFKND